MALTKVKAGNIILTTPGVSSNDVTPATTQYVTTAIGNLIDTAPSTLNTLNELAAALGDDVNFSTTVTNSIATKLPLAGGTLTGNLRGTSFSVGAADGGEALNILDGGHTGHGATNTVSLASFAENVSGNSSGPWLGSMTNENTAVIGARTASGNIGFQTYNAGWGERMRITASGNVGIGTTAPSNLLSLKGQGNNWNTSAGMKLWDSTYSKGWYVGTANNQAAGDYYIRSVTSESAYPVTADHCRVGAKRPRPVGGQLHPIHRSGDC